MYEILKMLSRGNVRFLILFRCKQEKAADPGAERAGAQGQDEPPLQAHGVYREAAARHHPADRGAVQDLCGADRPQPRILDGLTAQYAATAPAQGAGTAGRDNTSPPPKPPRQRRRTAQTGAQSKGNGLAERGGGTTLPPGFVERYCAAVLSADEGL